MRHWSSGFHKLWILLIYVYIYIYSLSHVNINSSEIDRVFSGKYFS